MMLPVGRPVPTGCDRRYAIGNNNAKIEQKRVKEAPSDETR